MHVRADTMPLAASPARVGAIGRLHGLLREMTLLLAATAALWSFHVFGRTLPTAAVVAVWALLTLVIARGLFWRARVRRRAFLTAYLHGASPLQRRLRGGWFMGLRVLALAALLALVLVVALLRVADPFVWVILLAGAMLLVVARSLLGYLLAPHASTAFLPELVWRVSLWAVAITMICALVWLAFHRAYPDLGTSSLQSAVWYFVEQERAQSALAELLLRVAAAMDGLRLWLAQQLMPQPGASFAQALGWLLVLAEGAVFVGSYLLLCSAVLIGLSRDERNDG